MNYTTGTGSHFTCIYMRDLNDIFLLSLYYFIYFAGKPISAEG